MEAWLDSTAGILDFASIMAKLLVGEKQGVRNAYIGKGGKKACKHFLFNPNAKLWKRNGIK